MYSTVCGNGTVVCRKMNFYCTLLYCTVLYIRILSLIVIAFSQMSVRHIKNSNILIRAIRLTYPSPAKGSVNNDN